MRKDLFSTNSIQTALCEMDCSLSVISYEVDLQSMNAS